MAAELVGGALLSSFLQVAFEKLLTTGQVANYFCKRRLNESLLDKLRIKLNSFNSVLDDAEAKYFTNQHVKYWLDRVKDVVLDAEDLLDEIDTEASRSDHEAEFQTTCCKVWNFCSASSSSFDEEIELKMKELLEKLEVLASQKDMLGLKEGSGVVVGLGKKVPQRVSTSLVDEAATYGRDDDKKIIIDLLLSNDGNGSNLSIISIVAMGGMGKTTVAQLVYNDQRMKDEFDLKAWVCVSEEFDVFRVTKAILEALTLCPDDTKDMNLLQVKLKEKLTGKKFLLVLDDIWNENYLDWEALRAPFIYGADGSKILVTTRSGKVASTMHAAKVYQLKQLAEEDSWLLFAKHAFHDEDHNSKAGLEQIGREIIKKCKGLPLALKAIGSLLYTKFSFEEWNSVLTSDMWEMSDEESNIIPALRLSYQHLPSDLKRCFAYCSLIPKGVEFDKERVVLLWMAENFLPCNQQNKSMKEVGDQFFHDLLSTSFFQQSSGDGAQFVMHDLVHDLARCVAGEFCFRLEAEKAPLASNMARHFSYPRYRYEYSKRFETIRNANRLRTFIPLSMYEGIGWIPRNMINELFCKFRCLRVLALCGYYNIVELPDSIGNLKLLRYLTLSYTRVKKLPDSVCLLYNLQTLKLRYCKSLEELPSNIHKLTNLRHLDFRGTKLRKVPLGLGKLKNLEVLSSFSVGKCGESNINQLSELNLRGTLSISELQNVTHPMDALAANLKKKMQLESLMLEWGMNHDGSQIDMDVLEKLQPHTNLKELSIINYAGISFPDSFGDNFLSNIVFLKLSNCKYCSFLPPLGILPSLKTLSVIGFDRIVAIGPELYGNNVSTAAFGSLQILRIEEMVGWEEWNCQNAPEAFPCLEELFIENCPVLKKQFPHQLPSLLKLKIADCKQLMTSIPLAPAIHGLFLTNCGSLHWESLASTLRILRICGPYIERSMLEKFEYTIANTFLEKLAVIDCPNLEFSIQHSHTFLREVNILESCDSLVTFPLNLFPNLQKLFLKDLSNLDCLSISNGHHLNLTSLTMLEIWGCPKFVSFPEGGFSAPNLEWCRIRCLESLKSLPEGMHILFPSLTCITLDDCPQIESFPVGGLPSNMRELSIYNCPKLIASRMTWDIHNHACLNYLSIKDANMESFPDQGLLPPTITTLSFSACLNLKTLDRNGLCHLLSLKKLNIYDCPRLRCLPKEGLPSSLSTLEICGDCQLLKQWCQKQLGKDWSQIANILCVKIDDDIIT